MCDTKIDNFQCVSDVISLSYLGAFWIHSIPFDSIQFHSNTVRHTRINCCGFYRRSSSSMSVCVCVGRRWVCVWDQMRPQHLYKSPICLSLILDISINMFRIIITRTVCMSEIAFVILWEWEWVSVCVWGREPTGWSARLCPNDDISMTTPHCFVRM